MKGDKKRLFDELTAGKTPEDLVIEGKVDIMNYLKLKKNYDAHRLATQKAEHKSKTRGVWLYGAPGTGKSYYARHHYGDDVYIKQQNKWWDGYTGQKTVVLDDHDTDVLAHHIKLWTDEYAL